MQRKRPSAFSGWQLGTVLAALVALTLAPVGADAVGTTFTVYAGRAPYNVSASASPTTNVAGIRDAIADVAAAGGGTIVLPAGTLVINHCYSDLYCLPLASNVTVVGQGRMATTVKVADGEHGSSFAVFGQPLGRALVNVHLAHFGIHGNRAHRAADSQMPGIRVGGLNKPISNLRLEDLYVRGNPGDAFQNMGNSTHVVMNNVVFSANGRNGITMDPVASTVSTDTVVTNAFLEGDQNAFDVEPSHKTGSVDGLMLNRCTLNLARPQSGNFTLALSSSYAYTYTGFARNVRVTNCTIFGGTSLVGVQNLRMDHNRIFAQHVAPISVRFQNDNVTIDNNIIDKATNTYTGFDNAAVKVLYPGGKGGPQPQHVSVLHNTITLHSEVQNGVVVAGAVFPTISGNLIQWSRSVPAANKANGIYVRTGATMNTVIIDDNRILNPRGFGIRVQADGALITDALLIRRNRIVDDQAVHTLTVGISVATTGPPSGRGALGVDAIYRNGTDNVVVER